MSIFGKISRNSLKIEKIDKKAQENKKNLLKFVKNRGIIQNSTTGVTFLNWEEFYECPVAR